MKKWLICMMALAAGSALGADGVGGLNLDLLGGSATSTVPLDIKAESMEYDRAAGVISASGGVVIKRPNEELRAESVKVNVETHDVEAHGKVVFTRAGNVWRGEDFYYNFASGLWKTGAFTAYFDPFQIQAQRAAKATPQEYVLHDAIVTTCTNALGHTHYSLKCRDVWLAPGDRMKARHVVIRAGPVPIFYLPYLYRSLADRNVGFSAEAGYSERMGAFLLTQTKYAINPTLRGETQLDGRTERGGAIGQAVGWQLDQDRGHGRAYGYYAYDNGLDEAYTGTDRSKVEEDRYRLRFDHAQSLSERDYFMTELNYLSDEFVMEDFFDSEYRSGFQPPNFANLSHRGDRYSAGVDASFRLNDFYESVDRLPEGTLDFARLRLGETPFYYEGENAAAYLEKKYPEEQSGTDDDYSSARFDSAHTLFYPTRSWGFLNFIPRTGYRATYYSDTVEREETDEFITMTTTNWVTGPDGLQTPQVTTTSGTNHVTRETAAGSDLRSLFELGAEVSFRSFRVLHNAESMFGTGMRHVVEPYANYSLVPEPNVRPDQLYQFDEIDELDKDHSIRFGTRNRLQTKRSERVVDVIDLDVWTTYRLEDYEEEPFTDIGWEGEMRMSSASQINFDGAYDLYESMVDYFNIRGTVRRDAWRTSLEYRYRDSDTSLLAGDIMWQLNKRWAVEVYERYEFETSRLEEQAYYLTRTFDCLGIKLGGSHLPGYTRDDGSEVEDEFRVYAQLWLTAFPNVRLGSTPRY